MKIIDLLGSSDQVAMTFCQLIFIIMLNFKLEEIWTNLSEGMSDHCLCIDTEKDTSLIIHLWSRVVQQTFQELVYKPHI